MPSPSERLSQEAYEQARHSIIKEGLSSRRKLLMAGGFIDSDEQDWDALAREILDKGTFQNKPLAEYGPEFQRMMAQVNAGAADIRDTVAENTGGFEFLQGATVGQAFSGLWAYIQKKGFMAGIQAIFGALFGGGDSQETKELKQEIARVTADDIGQGLRSRLTAHAAELDLNEAQINRAVREARNNVLTRVGLPAELPGPNEPPAQPAELTGDDHKMIRGQIRQKMLASLGLQEKGGHVTPDAQNSTGTAQLSDLAKIAGITAFTEKQASVLVDTMTDTMHHAATTAMRDPVKIRNHIQGGLKEKAQEMGFGAVSAEEQEKIFRVMANDATVSYLKARPIDKEAGEKFAKDTASDKRAMVESFIAKTASDSLAADFSSGSAQANLLTLARGSMDANTRAALGGAIAKGAAPIILNNNNAKLTDEQLYAKAKAQIEASLGSPQQLEAINSQGGFQLTKDMIPLISARAAGELVKRQRPEFKPPESQAGGLDPQGIENRKKEMFTAISNTVQNTIASVAEGEADKTRLAPANAITNAIANTDSWAPNWLKSGIEILPPVSIGLSIGRNAGIAITGNDPVESMIASRMPTPGEKKAMGDKVATAVDKLIFQGGKHEGKFFSQLQSQEEQYTALYNAIYNEIGDNTLGGTLDASRRQQIADEAAKGILEKARSSPIVPAAPPAQLVAGEQGKPYTPAIEPQPAVSPSL